MSVCKTKGDGAGKLIIAISPEIQDLNEKELVDSILEKLNGKDIGNKIASQIWAQADTLQVVRTHPKLTKGHKVLPIIKDPEQTSL